MGLQINIVYRVQYIVNDDNERGFCSCFFPFFFFLRSFHYVLYYCSILVCLYINTSKRSQLKSCYVTVLLAIHISYHIDLLEIQDEQL